MSTGAIELRHAKEADEAFEDTLANLSARNPGLFENASVRLSKDQLREIAKTFFYLGFAAGESVSDQ